MLFVELSKATVFDCVLVGNFADTIIVYHGCDGVRKINTGKLSDLTCFIGRLNKARLILGGREEKKS